LARVAGQEVGGADALTSSATFQALDPQTRLPLRPYTSPLDAECEDGEIVLSYDPKSAAGLLGGASSASGCNCGAQESSWR
jgi:hypothetical protein